MIERGEQGQEQGEEDQEEQGRPGYGEHFDGKYLAPERANGMIGCGNKYRGPWTHCWSELVVSRQTGGGRQ